MNAPSDPGPESERSLVGASYFASVNRFTEQRTKLMRCLGAGALLYRR
jgi:hypothetical protein